MHSRHCWEASTWHDVRQIKLRDNVTLTPDGHRRIYEHLDIASGGQLTQSELFFSDISVLLGNQDHDPRETLSWAKNMRSQGWSASSPSNSLNSGELARYSQFKVWRQTMATTVERLQDPGSGSSRVLLLFQHQYQLPSCCSFFYDAILPFCRF